MTPKTTEQTHDNKTTNNETQNNKNQIELLENSNSLSQNVTAERLYEAKIRERIESAKALEWEKLEKSFGKIPEISVQHIDNDNAELDILIAQLSKSSVTQNIIQSNDLSHNAVLDNATMATNNTKKHTYELRDDVKNQEILHKGRKLGITVNTQMKNQGQSLMSASKGHNSEPHTGYAQQNLNPSFSNETRNNQNISKQVGISVTATRSNKNAANRSHSPVHIMAKNHTFKPLTLYISKFNKHLHKSLSSVYLETIYTCT